MKVIEKFPLTWPEGWPRTKVPSVSKFGNHSIREAVNEIGTQLARLGLTEVIVSINPSIATPPKDKGAAIFFRFRGRDSALACDRWNDLPDNLWAIGKHLEALRGQERWGVGSMEQAFAGYTALPPIGRGCFEVLGLTDEASVEAIKSAFRELAKKTHPDHGGSPEQFNRLKSAYDEALNKKEVGK